MSQNKITITKKSHLYPKMFYIFNLYVVYFLMIKFLQLNRHFIKISNLCRVYLDYIRFGFPERIFHFGTLHKVF